MSHSRRDRWLHHGARLAALATGLLTVWIALFLAREAWPALTGIAPQRFLTDGGWYPTENEYGMLPMVLATVAVTVGAVLLATPLGLLSAVFGEYIAPRGVAAVYDRLVNVLAGIPSVVYGFWGVVVLIPLLNRLRPPGASLLAGVLILAVMILPTLALIVRAGLRALPGEYLIGAAALGLSRWTTLRRIVLPAQRGTVATAILLATGRAAGETMAVLMVCGNIVQVPTSLFLPVRTLTANIALEMAYALDLHRAALFLSGLLLLALVTALALLAARLQPPSERTAP